VDLTDGLSQRQSEVGQHARSGLAMYAPRCQALAGQTSST
jgi:hypothetical protein